MKSRKWCGKRQGTERKIGEEKTRSHLMGSVKNRPFWGVLESVRVFFGVFKKLSLFMFGRIRFLSNPHFLSHRIWHQMKELFGELHFSRTIIKIDF